MPGQCGSALHTGEMMSEVSAPAPIGELGHPGDDNGEEYPPIPPELLSAARDGDANAVRAIADWLREEGCPTVAAWCAVLAEEMALSASLALHLYRILSNVPKPKPVPGQRTTREAIRMEFGATAGLSLDLLNIIGPYRGVVDEGGTPRTVFTFRVPRHHVGGFDDESEGCRVADAILDYARAAFPRGRFEVEEADNTLSRFGRNAAELLGFHLRSD